MTKTDLLESLISIFLYISAIAIMYQQGADWYQNCMLTCIMATLINPAMKS
jgi:hypothetical protein